MNTVTATKLPAWGDETEATFEKQAVSKMRGSNLRASPWPLQASRLVGSLGETVFPLVHGSTGERNPNGYAM